MFLYKEKTETYHSCSLTWQGKLYVFGGDKEKRQISVLNGCTLERISYLNSDHYWGACTNMNDQIYLCFNMGPTEDYKNVAFQVVQKVNLWKYLKVISIMHRHG